MTFDQIDFDELGLHLTAAALVGRGAWETFTLMLRTPDTQVNILIALTVMLGISGALFFIGRSLMKWQKLGWQTALTVAMIYATTDIMFTALGETQPVYEIIVDMFLIGSLILNRDKFFSEEIRTFR